MPTLEDAIALAVNAHQGQVEKAGAPYILHVLRVMFRVESEAERIAAVLHDLVEDTDYSLEDLRAMGYPVEVLRAVDCLTKRAGETYNEFVERAAGDPIARRVKIADLEDNMDLRRLPALGAKDTDRLKHYVAAWHRLKRGS